MNLFNIKKEEFNSFFKEQKSHWNLFIWIFLYSLIPACWILIRTIVITRYMSASVDTYAQWDYLNIMLEVIQETIVLPLFWWFGSIKIEKKEDLNKIREVYIFTFIIYFIIISTLNIFVGDLVKVIGSEQGYKQKVFFSLQLWSKIPSILTGVSTVILLNLKNYKGFLVLLISKLIISVTLDFTLANNKVFDNAYIGLGLSTFLSEVCLFITSIIMLAYIFGFKTFFNLKTFSFDFKKWNFNKVFFSNVLASFLFSIINNTFYLFMIAKNMNIAKESDAYWLSNTVIWSWILMIPNVIFSINKSIVSTQKELNFKKRVMLILEFQLISLLSILLSFAIFIPIYRQFTMFLSGNNVDLINRSWTIFSKLIGFFIFYVLSSTLSAHFNGEGKNWLMATQALVCNALTFIPFIIINSIGALQYTVDVLALIFGFSLMVSWIIGTIFIAGFLYIENLKEKKKQLI